MTQAHDRIRHVLDNVLDENTSASVHGISTGDPPRSGCRPPTRLGHPLGRPESPLRAKIKSGNQKKIGFPHPTSYMYEPRGCVHEIGIFARYSSQRRTATYAPVQRNTGARPPRSAHPGPLSGSVCSRFFARSGRKMAPPPPAVCAHAAAAAFLLPHKGPRGCPGSGASVRKILSAAALVVSRN